MKTSNQRIKSIDPIDPPAKLLNDMPLDSSCTSLVVQTRHNIAELLHGHSDRLLVVVGPCSVHDVESALDYAQRLLILRKLHSNELEIVMRVYFEKPRSTVGWKGLINDPDLNKSYRVNKGLRLARQLLLDINATGMPAGTEFLDAVTGQYYSDLISWGAIGARTTESQVHRELASGLSCPVGFKNGTNGNLGIALDAVIAAGSEHIFLSPTDTGHTAMFTTEGNADAHIILRGGLKPNYNAASIALASAELQKRKINTGLMVDFSHANSDKKYKRQLVVGADVAQQISQGDSSIVACMIESHINEGKQSVSAGSELQYGMSITDGCIGWADTEVLVKQLAQAVSERRVLMAQG